jgi:hypothetical protein
MTILKIREAECAWGSVNQWYQTWETEINKNWEDLEKEDLCELLGLKPEGWEIDDCGFDDCIYLEYYEEESAHLLECIEIRKGE